MGHIGEPAAIRDQPAPRRWGPGEAWILPSPLLLSCEPPCVHALWPQVYGGVLAATLRQGWRNLGGRTGAVTGASVAALWRCDDRLWPVRRAGRLQAGGG